jgi:hypothetical protein
MNNFDALICKIYLPDNEIRRVRISTDISLQNLKSRIIECLVHSELVSDQEKDVPLTLSYQDGENDWINVDSVEEWQEALNCCRFLPILKIRVKIVKKKQQDQEKLPEILTINPMYKIEYQIDEIDSPVNHIGPETFKKNVLDAFVEDYYGEENEELPPVEDIMSYEVLEGNSAEAAVPTLDDSLEVNEQELRKQMEISMTEHLHEKENDCKLVMDDVDMLYEEQLSELFMMGIEDDRDNLIRLLVKHKGDVQKVVNELF